MRRRQAWTQLQRLTVLAFRGSPVPIVSLDHRRQRHVPLGETRIQFQRFQRRRPRLLHPFTWRYVTELREQIVPIRQRRIRRRELRRPRRRLFEAQDPLAQRALRLPVQRVAPANQQVLRHRIRVDAARSGVRPCDPQHRDPRQNHHQRHRRQQESRPQPLPDLRHRTSRRRSRHD